MRARNRKSRSLTRIYHECEGRIEKSFLRITIWHHEACRVMTNGDPRGQIFLSHPHMNNGFLFSPTLRLHCWLASTASTVLSAKSDSDIMFCLQSYLN